MAYGPIVAGDQGVQYLTVRVQGDPGPQYMPESRLARKRVHGRHITRTVSPTAADPVVEVERPHPDGLAVYLVNTEAGSEAVLPDVNNVDGLHMFVLSGALERGGVRLPRLSNIFLEAVETAPVGLGGPDGVSLLLLYFPKRAADADE
jgi:hypothetical protein